MDKALEQLHADAVILAESSGDKISEYKYSGIEEDPAPILDSFRSLDKLALSLKMGPLKQLVAVRGSEADITTRHDGTGAVSIVAADRLDKAVVAESLVTKLLS